MVCDRISVEELIGLMQEALKRIADEAGEVGVGGWDGYFALPVEEKFIKTVSFPPTANLFGSLEDDIEFLKLEAELGCSNPSAVLERAGALIEFLGVQGRLNGEPVSSEGSIS